MRILDLFDGSSDRALVDRFWSHVEVRGPDECWLWSSALRPNGYGQMMTKARVPVKAHRLSFVIAFGWEPPCVLHKCDNPPCVNPHHLMGGTVADNQADCAAKGRYARQLSTAVHSTVLALAECGVSQRAIARQVGIDRRSVGRIIARAAQ